MIYFYYKIKKIREVIKTGMVTVNIKYYSDMDMCVICFDNFSEESNIRKIKNCRHYFHYNCLDDWLVKYEKRECPTCRTDVN